VIDEGLENPDKDVVGELILGGANFVNWIKDTYLSDKSGHKKIPHLNELRPRVKLSNIVQRVCEESNCDWV
jgi:hypothetical protein